MWPDVLAMLVVFGLPVGLLLWLFVAVGQARRRREADRSARALRQATLREQARASHHHQARPIGRVNGHGHPRPWGGDAA